MTIRVGINGFGRMGRLALRTIIERFSDELTVVHINDPHCNAESAAHLTKYDSQHGIFPYDVTYCDEHLVVDKYSISLSTEITI